MVDGSKKTESEDERIHAREHLLFLVLTCFFVSFCLWLFCIEEREEWKRRGVPAKGSI